jgi:hypothetical protein
VHCCDRVEGLGREDDLGTMAERCEETKCEAKAVEKRWWTAESVVWREVHAVTDEAGVIHEVAGGHSVHVRIKNVGSTY